MKPYIYMNSVYLNKLEKTLNKTIYDFLLNKNYKF